MRHAIRAVAAAITTLSAASAGTADAWQADEVIVVTGARLEAFEDDFVPYVHLVRQADAISVRLRVTCDTRDRTQRLEELRATLRNLVRAADRNRQVEAGLLIRQAEFGNEIIIDFDTTMTESVEVRAGRGRSDVSEVVIMASTPIGDGDTVDSAAGRINSFIRQVELVGRTEVLNTGNWELTVTGGPSRYRQEIVSAIAANARETAASFGPDFEIGVSGLEGPVRWQQSSALELSLYIDYTLQVASGE